MNNSFCVILCTCPNFDTAEKIANEILINKLAACVNIINGITSKYWWEGKIQKDNENLLFIKTSESLFDKVKDKILSIHPYEIPEIVSIPINQGHKAYLNWIKNSIKNEFI